MEGHSDAASWPFGPEPKSAQSDSDFSKFGTPNPSKSNQHYDAPEVVVPNAPEVNRISEAPQGVHKPQPYPDPYSLESTPSDYRPQERRIWRIPRTRFFIILAAVTLIVIAAIAGGVAGGLLANQDSTDSAPSLANGTSSPSTPSTASEGPLYDLSPTSNLATVNWTIGDVEYIRVYYQQPSGGIVQAAWASDSVKWKASAITDYSTLKNVDGSDIESNSPIDVKADTPLTATNFNGDDIRDFVINVFYLDSFNVVRYIWTSSPEGPWYTNGRRDLGNAGEGSQLAATWIQDCHCSHPSLVLFQGEDGALRHLKQHAWTDSTPIPADDLAPIPAGAAFFVTPVKSHVGMRLVYNGFEGDLGGLVYDPIPAPDLQWRPWDDEPIGLDESSHLTAYANGDLLGRYRFFWVYHTRSQGGVASLKGTNTEDGDLVWEEGEVDQSAMADVAPNAAIVANQIGMIFAITTVKTAQGTNASALVQWTLNGDGIAEKVGEVPTRVEA